jgi:hypothetical protein
MIDLAPAVYSDDDPTAMQLLKANANDFTAEGKEYKRRHIIYEKNIDKFVHERNTEQIK